jgi:phospholipase C
MTRQRTGLLLALAVAALLAALGGAAGAQPVNSHGLGRIDRIVVVFLENRSFDNMFGLFPGANGLAQARPETTIQVDREGRPYAALPPVMDTHAKPPVPDRRFPPILENRPFLIDGYVGLHDKDPDLVHRWYQQQAQINGGRMDKFAAISDAGGLVMGYHDASKTRLWEWARQYTLADNFFHAAFGGSFLNHFWLVCACTPRFPNAPADIVAQISPTGEVVKDGVVTPDGYAVNTSFSAFQPHPPNIPPAKLVPPQTAPTIGDRLDEKGISWAWYSGGWNAALAGNYGRAFQFHHQPFAYFRNYGDGTDARRHHLKDETDLQAAIDSDTLPAVTFYKPVGEDNEHPGYASIDAGDAKVAGLLGRLAASPMFRSMAIIVTYDENGGFWDHVTPPRIDRWGPGARVPAVIISPFARRGFIDHTFYDTTSVLRLIETRYGLAPLTERDAGANDLTNAFAFTRR